MGTGLDVGVVGGGWSGMAAAWNLRRAGASVTLYDNQPELGGRSIGVPFGPRTVTAGGKNIGRKYENFRAFAEDMGCREFEFFGISSSRAEGSRVRTFDSTRRISSMVSLLRKAPARDIARVLRLVRAVRGRRENSFCGGPDLVRIARRAGDPPLSDYFGERLRQVMARPLTIRMNGAEPDEVYLECFGTHLGMLVDTFEQLSTGFDDMFAAFAGQVTVRSGITVTGLAAGAANVELTAADGDGGEHRAVHDAVVVALPGPAAAELTASLSADLAAGLRDVSYFPAAVVLAEYDRPVFGEQVRAMFFRPDSPLSNAGAYGVNDRHIIRYTFSGRAYRNSPLDDSGLLDLAEGQLQKYADVGSATRVRTAAKRWEHAYCGYSRFHSATIARIDQALAGTDRVALTGDYVRGASIEACFRAAIERTDALLARPGLAATGATDRRQPGEALTGPS